MGTFCFIEVVVRMGDLSKVDNPDNKAMHKLSNKLVREKDPIIRIGEHGKFHDFYYVLCSRQNLSRANKYRRLEIIYLI